MRYDHEALVGILALEAQRAGAVVIGEDLGTVEPWVRDYLRERGIFGTSILWFEKDDGRAAAGAGALARALPGHGHHPRPAADRGIPCGRAHPAARRARPADPAGRGGAGRGRARPGRPCSTCCGGAGCCEDDAGTRATVEALHRLIAWTPARLIGVALTDAVGEVRTMNQPGTDKEYPNWRLPLADETGRPVLLEELVRSRRARDLARAAATG